MLDAVALEATQRRRVSALPLRGVAEVTALICVYAVYAMLRNLATGSPAAAAAHADQILHLERAVGLDLGQRIRDATDHLAWLTSGANLVYASHSVVPIVVLFLLYRYRRAAYTRWRNTFLVMLVLGLVGYWLYPLMPPDILSASYHFVDSGPILVVGHTPLHGAIVPHPDRFDVLGFSNPYAAMPSLHVGWALFAALATWPLVRSRRLRAATLLYPLAMSAAVVLTANHWIFDAVAGVLTLAIAYPAARTLERVRIPARAAARAKAGLPVTSTSSRSSNGGDG
jgi:PAP2 superfamily